MAEMKQTQLTDMSAGSCHGEPDAPKHPREHIPPARRRSSLGSDDCERVASLALKHATNYERRSSFRNVAKEESVRRLRLDDLMIGKLLGTGSFNNVYQASVSSHNDLSLDGEDGEKEGTRDITYRGGDCHYAVKQLKFQVMEDPDEYAIGAIDLAMEAKFLSSMNHENIVKLHGVTSGCVTEAFSSGLEGGYFLVIDKMQSTLNKRLREWAEEKEANKTWARRKASSPPNKICGRLYVALGIARGLQYLHSNNIIYRDLKPDNIGFDAAGKVKIFDFGLARELFPNDDKRPTGMTGTIRYMAPENARYQHYGLPSDTYSFGILLWEICALKKPYQSYHMNGKLNQKAWNEDIVHGDKRPKLKRSWSKGLKSLMRDCWAADASQRPEMGSVVSLIDTEISMVAERSRGRRPKSSLRPLRAFSAFTDSTCEASNHTSLHDDC